MRLRDILGIEGINVSHTATDAQFEEEHVFFSFPIIRSLFFPSLFWGEMSSFWCLSVRKSALHELVYSVECAELVVLFFKSCNLYFFFCANASKKQTTSK